MIWKKLVVLWIRFFRSTILSNTELQPLSINSESTFRHSKNIRHWKTYQPMKIQTIRLSYLSSLIKSKAELSIFKLYFKISKNYWKKKSFLCLSNRNLSSMKKRRWKVFREGKVLIKIKNKKQECKNYSGWCKNMFGLISINWMEKLNKFQTKFWLKLISTSLDKSLRNFSLKIMSKIKENLQKRNSIEVWETIRKISLWKDCKKKDARLL